MIGQEIQEEEIHVERVIPIYGVFFILDLKDGSSY